ncbi:oligosaccharide flippase family protein [Klebsiella pneumoniae]|nr:oligosaccharide flippase family protein [Klebsiella pneumoniae]
MRLSIIRYGYYLRELLQFCLHLQLASFLARYLGPNDFGVYNYLISIITLLTPLIALGLNAVVVRDLVDAQREEQNDTNVILGTSCILRFFGGLFACVSLLLVDIYFNISQHR